MINFQNSTMRISRDGTSQQDRNVDAIRPDYVEVEDRSIQELISEAQRLAKELQFFNANNEPTANWESFLIDDPQTFAQGSPERKRIQQQRWAEELAEFIDQPERFYEDQTKMSKLSKPHVALFSTFLKLLNHVKKEINGLTQKHLDFYFRERLNLHPEEAVPDVVNVMLKLTENTDFLEVKKGTVLQAGEDQAGNPLLYATEEDTIISQAKINQLSTVYVQKEIRRIPSVHQDTRKSTSDRFTDMFEMALGHPNPSDALPDFPKSSITDVFSLHESVLSGDNEAINYVNQQLFLTEEQFTFIFAQQEAQVEGLDAEWDRVYEMLDQAHKDKIKDSRERNLRSIHEEQGFDEMIKHIYGSPNPSDELPLYRGGVGSFDSVFADLNGASIDQAKALEYIEEILFLKQLDFVHIMTTKANQNAEEAAKVKMYQLLELADRQVRSFVFQSPSIENLSDVFATSDAKEFAFSQYDEEEESKRFKTFGNRLESIEDQTLKPSELGFAISSPIFLLKEGTRNIEILLDLNSNAKEKETLEEILESGDPFITRISSEKEWFQPDEKRYFVSDFVGEALDKVMEIDVLQDEIKSTNTLNFDENDIGRYLVDATKSIYEIIGLSDLKTVQVKRVGELDVDHPVTKQYDASQVFLKSLKVSIKLREDAPSVQALFVANNETVFQSKLPSVVFTLNATLQGKLAKQTFKSFYENLVKCGLKKVNIRVDVDGMKDLVAQNERSTLNIKKPFDPFGFEPSVGDSFYFANEEVCKKRLSDLRLNVEWSKPPASFKDHYANYWKIRANNANLSESEFLIKSNDDLQGELFLHDGTSEVHLSKQFEDENGQLFQESVKLFENGGELIVDGLLGRMKQTSPGYRYVQKADLDTDEEDAIEWDRYFRLELAPIDFQHSTYTTLFARQALSTVDAVRELEIPQPYQPKIKKLSMGYTAKTTIVSGAEGSKNEDQLFHLHPFGFKSISLDEEHTLIPLYEDEGSLFIGIGTLNAPQTLSILFQMAEGSANPDVEKPQLIWNYLRNNEWVMFKPSQILKDSTNGLVNSGIVQLKIPSDATTGGTLMPDELHWVKVETTQNSKGVSDTIDVRAQALSAKLSSEVVDASHFENPLAPNEIKQTLNPISEVDKIEQPFTSSKGRPAESGDSLYTRISERLRHKNRALTTWDYEHLVLNQFPEVYKAKCLPSETAAGKVDVVVVPDIIGRLPFNPFAPKVAADTLLRIQQFLSQHAPAFTDVQVTNPSYLQVSTECVVKFYPGFDEDFYKAKLIEEIKRFMSPWAYGVDHDIHIGGSLHASVIINFIAERPYIDYVANLKLFQSEDGRTFSDVRGINDGKTIVVPSSPEMIMVAAQIHEVYVVNEGGFDIDSFEGVNYMEISKDFIVS